MIVSEGRVGVIGATFGEVACDGERVTCVTPQTNHNEMR